MNDMDLTKMIMSRMGYSEQCVNCNSCEWHQESERSGEWNGQCIRFSELVTFSVKGDDGHCTMWSDKYA